MGKNIYLLTDSEKLHVINFALAIFRENYKTLDVDQILAVSFQVIYGVNPGRVNVHEPFKLSFTEAKEKFGANGDAMIWYYDIDNAYVLKKMYLEHLMTKFV